MYDGGGGGMASHTATDPSLTSWVTGHLMVGTPPGLECQEAESSIRTTINADLAGKEEELKPEDGRYGYDDAADTVCEEQQPKREGVRGEGSNRRDENKSTLGVFAATIGPGTEPKEALDLEKESSDSATSHYLFGRIISRGLKTVKPVETLGHGPVALVAPVNKTAGSRSQVSKCHKASIDSSVDEMVFSQAAYKYNWLLSYPAVSVVDCSGCVPRSDQQHADGSLLQPFLQSFNHCC